MWTDQRSQNPKEETIKIKKNYMNVNPQRSKREIVESQAIFVL